MRRLDITCRHVISIHDVISYLYMTSYAYGYPLAASQCLQKSQTHRSESYEYDVRKSYTYERVISVYERVISVYERVISVYERVISVYERVISVYERVISVYERVICVWLSTWSFATLTEESYTYERVIHI